MPGRIDSGDRPQGGCGEAILDSGSTLSSKKGGERNA